MRHFVRSPTPAPRRGVGSLSLARLTLRPLSALVGFSRFVAFKAPKARKPEAHTHTHTQTHTRHNSACLVQQNLRGAPRLGAFTHSPTSPPLADRSPNSREAPPTRGGANSVLFLPALHPQHSPPARHGAARRSDPAGRGSCADRLEKTHPAAEPGSSDPQPRAHRLWGCAWGAKGAASQTEVRQGRGGSVEGVGKSQAG